MSSILYNDDIELTESDIYTGSDNISDVSDNSAPEIDPTIDPYPVVDNTQRSDDGWLEDHTANGGTEGTVYPNIPPVEKDPLEYSTKIIKEKTRIVLHEYSTEYLQNLYNQNAKFYVVYTDGTIEEISYTDVYDPHQINQDVYVNEAMEIANATNQHFWHDDVGAHVTDVEQDDWKTAANVNFNDLSDSKPYHNILMNSLGILLRRAFNNLVAISKSAITFYDGLGNSLANIRASFGSEGATFRENGKTKATITTNGLSIYDNDGSISNNTETLGTRLAFIGIDESGKPYSKIGGSTKGYIEIGVNSNDNGYIDLYNGDHILAHIGYDIGINASGGNSLAPYYNLGFRKQSTAIGNYSMAEGIDTIASAYSAHAEGTNTMAAGHYSHAEGYNTTASGTYSHAEGCWTSASGNESHAEGYRTVANKNYSHAEGYYATASGSYSHAEGYYTTASGESSHTENVQTKASGQYSHAEGHGTEASAYCSHTEGDATKASGSYSHAEGDTTAASGNYSHAEGCHTTASGSASHASGYYTTAAYSYQFACGKYNSNFSSDLFEVGNGSTYSSSNAFRVTEAGTAFMGSTSVTSDKRVKTDLGELNPSHAIDFIKKLIPHKYEKFGRKELGFFAQDVEKDPNYGNVLVEQYEDHGYEDFRSLSYDGLIAPIVSVEQNLIERIEQLEKENSELKIQNESLNRRLSAIEEKLGVEI